MNNLWSAIASYQTTDTIKNVSFHPMYSGFIFSFLLFSFLFFFFTSIEIWFLESMEITHGFLPSFPHHVVSLRRPDSRSRKLKLFDLEWKKIKENRWYMGCGNEFQVGQKPSFSVISKLIIFLFCLRREVTVLSMFYDLCNSSSSSSCHILSAL